MGALKRTVVGLFEVSQLLQLMLKMSTICTDAGSQALMPLLDCLVDNALVKKTPFLQQPLFQMIHVSDPTPVD